MLDRKKIILVITFLLIFLLLNNSNIILNEDFYNKYGSSADPYHSDFKEKKKDTFLSDSRKKVIIINETKKLLKKKKTKISGLGDLTGGALGAATGSLADPSKAIASAGSLSKGMAGPFIKLPVNREKDIDEKFVMRIAPYDLVGNTRPLGSKTDVCVVSSNQIMPKIKGKESSRDKDVKTNLESKKFYRILIINQDNTSETSLKNSLFGSYGYHQKKLYQFGVSIVPYKEVCKILVNNFFFDKSYFSNKYLPSYREKVKSKQREIYKIPIKIEEGTDYIKKKDEMMKDKNFVFVSPPLEILALPSIRYFFTKVKKPMLLGYHDYTPEEYDEDDDDLSYSKIMDMYYNFYEAELKIENFNYLIEKTFGEIYEIKFRKENKKRPNFTQKDIDMMKEGAQKEEKKAELVYYNNFKNTYPKILLDIDRDEDEEDEDNNSYVSNEQKMITEKEFYIIENKNNIIEQEEIKRENLVTMNNNNIRIFILGLFFVNYRYSVYKDKD